MTTFPVVKSVGMSFSVGVLGRREGQWLEKSLGEQEGHNPTFRSSGMNRVKETVLN